jgi:hypothetical protein
MRGEIGPELTKEGNKNKDNQHPNTPIPFKRGINERGGKRDDFFSSPKQATTLTTAAFPLAKRTHPNQLTCHLS